MKKKTLPGSINQLLPCYSAHDAIGTHVTSINKLLVERGFKSNIYSEITGHQVPIAPETAEVYFESSTADSIVIYHYSTGSMIPCRLYGDPAFKVTNYHNITPANFFAIRGEEQAQETTRQGRTQMPMVRMCTDATWTESRYNADEIEGFGFPKSELFPILRNYSALTAEPENVELAKKLKDGKKNILFVGRMAPNKAPHDLLFLLKQYQKFISPNTRLLLIGFSQSPYAQVQLKELAKTLDLHLAEDLSAPAIARCDVLMPGQVSDSDLATIYRSSDAFVCLSDHEGFCVPLVESMYFGIPVLAHSATAVPETLGDAGILIDKRDMVAAVEGLNALLNHKDINQQYRELALNRSKRFDWSKIVGEFDLALDKTLKQYADSRSL